MLFDQVGFSQYSFHFTAHHDPFQAPDMADHGQILWRLAFTFLKIGPDPAAEILGLADIDNLLIFIRKTIHAWRRGNVFQLGLQGHNRFNLTNNSKRIILPRLKGILRLNGDFCKF